MGEAVNTQALRSIVAELSHCEPATDQLRSVMLANAISIDRAHDRDDRFADRVRTHFLGKSRNAQKKALEGISGLFLSR